MTASGYRSTQGYATMPEAAQTGLAVWVVSRLWVLLHPGAARFLISETYYYGIGVLSILFFGFWFSPDRSSTLKILVYSGVGSQPGMAELSGMQPATASQLS